MAKKYLMIFLAIVILILTGCGTNQKDKKKNGVSTSPTVNKKTGGIDEKGNNGGNNRQPHPGDNGVDRNASRGIDKKDRHVSSKMISKAKKLQETGKYGDARLKFKEALQRNPKSRDALVGLAKLYQNQSKTTTAVRYYDRAIKLNPNDKGLYEDKAQALKRGGRYGDAVSTLEKLKSMDPKNMEVYRELAYCYRRMNRPTRARDVLLEAVNATPGNYRAYKLYADHLNRMIPTSKPQEEQRLARQAANAYARAAGLYKGDSKNEKESLLKKSIRVYYYLWRHTRRENHRKIAMAEIKAYIRKWKGKPGYKSSVQWAEEKLNKLKHRDKVRPRR